MNKDNNTIVLNIEVKGSWSEEEIAAVVKRELDEMVANTKPKFPEWEELGRIEGFYIDDYSTIDGCSGNTSSNYAKNIWPTKELAEAQLAMSQLAHLRDYVNDGWEPDWTNSTNKYCITIIKGEMERDCWYNTQQFLTLKDKETRDGFLEAYRDLIEIAKPLL